ncbi:hypothetical protein JWS13_19945 [Rhodococcus pseudokoreensis]|uniref:Uncharacterized protein n=1 Tax=Rhodococcus pseudokoreensis TaxID=2811421 RepID=A0A974W3U2_9NOCA|nr:hypothetical protein [Rhodococcus pseudokoreensis]QSE90734.1 hypothetical protein JWS13_19945 [Rhodococcus pseudokoreensis]
MTTDPHVLVHRGLGCTAVFDPIERTVTLFHFGILTHRCKKRISPRVIPLADVTAITHSKESCFKRGSIRLERRSGAGYHSNILKDVNGYFDVDGDTEGEMFAQAISLFIEQQSPP